MPGNSIRARLVLRLVPIVILCWAVTAAFVYFGTRAELRDALNAQSDILALTIAGLEGDEIPIEAFGEGLERYAGDYVVRVWRPDGALIFDSQAAFEDMASGLVQATAGAELGPEWVVRDYTLQSGETVLIARLQQEADELVLQVALTSILPLALALIGSILTALLLVKQGLSPLTSLSQELTRRSASDLGQLPDTTPPDELKPIVDELNGLFGRISTVLARERRFVDDAAHELRTPLSVVRAQCQAIDPAVLDPETTQRVINIVEGIDRMSALSSQLLDQARAEHEGAKPETVRVAPILRSVIADLTPQIEQVKVTLTLVDEADPEVLCVVGDIRQIMRNLIENAVKFSDRPGQVQVRLAASGVTVDDNGAGVSEANRDRIFDRFFQDNTASDSPFGKGAGLGLSIVQSLAHRNEMSVGVGHSETLGGAQFMLTWGFV